MRHHRTAIACWVVIVAAQAEAAGADDPSPAQRAEIARRHALDPGSRVDSRIRPTSQAVLRMFEDAGMPPPTPHELSDAERAKLSAALEGLPPLHRQVLRERLRSLNFLDGMPNTALTSPVNPGEPFRLFDITIRAAIFGEDVSQWLTWKERTCYEGDRSPLRVTVEAGHLDAIAYVLLHEATHIVDLSREITSPDHPGGSGAAHPRPSRFSDGIWTDQTTPAPPYRDPLLARTKYYVGGRVLPIDQAESVYQALRRTPFASLYGGNNRGDDLAEYVAMYHFTQVLGQPYRIVVSRDGRAISTYEPMDSALVRSRFGQMDQFYEDPEKGPGPRP